MGDKCATLGKLDGRQAANRSNAPPVRLINPVFPTIGINGLLAIFAIPGQVFVPALLFLLAAQHGAELPWPEHMCIAVLIEFMQLPVHPLVDLQMGVQLDSDIELTSEHLT